MFEIVNKQLLAQQIKRMDIYAPQIAQKIQPGQFVKILPLERELGIPLSIVDSDPKR